MSASKHKGTGGETELVNLLRAQGLTAVRTPPASPYDIRVGMPGPAGGMPVLATRPDHGEWLMTVRLMDLIDLWRVAGLYYKMPDLPVNIEVKRHKKFSLHTIFQSKFGRKA